LKDFNELKNDFDIDKWLSKNNGKSDCMNASNNIRNIEKTKKCSEKSKSKSLLRKKINLNLNLSLPNKCNKNNLDKYLDFVMNENQVKKIYEDEDDHSSSDESEFIDNSYWPSYQ